MKVSEPRSGCGGLQRANEEGREEGEEARLRSSELSLSDPPPGLMMRVSALVCLRAHAVSLPMRYEWRGGGPKKIVFSIRMHYDEPLTM
jgi:hypothetical protein